MGVSIMPRTVIRISLLVAHSFLAIACSGGGSGSAGQPTVTIPPPPPPPPPPAPTSVNLSSDAGDPIGAGQSYSYTNADAQITVTSQDARFTIDIDGDEYWRGKFKLPDTYTALQRGTYENLTRFGFHDPAVGGLSWTGEGRGCNTSSGRLIIDSVTFDGTTLTEIDLQFEQYCSGSTAALRGDIHWNANDATSPPGPVVPPPAGLWEPAQGTTPSSDNYIYLESAPGDYIGAGANYLYTGATALISVHAANARLSVGINANEGWNGDFQAMSSVSFLEVGYYPDVQRYPFHNPTKGGMSWSGESRVCGNVTGWFLVDSVTYDGNTLTAISLRFEQLCEHSFGALRGEIHWDASDTTGPPGPVVPPPAGLWQPAASVTPDTGNYVYLESDPGDFIGQGRNYLYTPVESVLTVDAEGARLSVSINGNEYWNGTFQAMNTLSRLEVGYYGDLLGYPFHNPVKGGLEWYGEHRGCNTRTGWFVIDNVTYDGTTLMAIDLRFQQHCDGGAPALNGEVHWDANDTTGPPGPVVPPPAGLWQPAQGITPDTGNYVYLESEPGDFIGQGRHYLYIPAHSHLSIAGTGASLSVSIDGDELWDGRFLGMNSLSRLEVGYYGDLQRPFQDPVGAGLSWAGEGRGCGTLTGWFVIDNVTYDGDTLMAIDLRFEQHCEGGGPALNGEVHWDANDTTVPGPVVPPPAGLWEPAQGTTPDTGNYVYLESEPGDFIGAGGTYLYTPADSVLTVDAQGAGLTVSINGNEYWNGTFLGMNSLSRLEVGYYGGLQRFPFHNPVRGALDWDGEHRGCNTLIGWFVIDNVSYDGDTLVAIDLRFEQHCERGAPALNGEVHWDASDTTAALGPVAPSPVVLPLAGLWEPAQGITPDTGDYVYLDSQPGDYIGAGGNFLYIPSDSQLTLDSSGPQFWVAVSENVFWNGRSQSKSA